MKEDTETDRKGNNRHPDFNGLLMESVDETFAEVLGAKLSSIVWRHDQEFLGITREAIPYQLPKLFESIQTIFGTNQSMGERVIRKLYAKANVPLNYCHTRPLLEYAEELKQALARSQHQD